MGQQVIQKSDAETESESENERHDVDEGDEKKLDNGMDDVELFMVMTASDIQIAHKYMNIAGGNLNIAINIYMEDMEKRELRKLTPPNNKWKKNKSKKKKRKQKQNKKKKINIFQQPDDDEKREHNIENNKQKKKKTDGQPLLPPIIFQ